MTKKPIAIFDIDGTIFRSSLTVELFERLVIRGIIGRAGLLRVRASEKKWLDRVGHYDDYIRDLVVAYQKAIVGKKRADIIKSCREVVKEQRFRTYRYTLSLLAKIRGKYFTIGISGSPLEVVREYNKFLKFDKVYGTEIGVDECGRYTRVVLHEPPRYKKEVVIRYIKGHDMNFKNSMGVGDTESDIGFLELVDKPIAFNPNTKLAKAAKKHRWPIVIERKDLVVELNPGQVKYLKI
ncbi:hypothetical protein D4R52_02695 [bacterium]|nr:MAG: hypothetical protein D4R52_02695 [bacterium]